MIDRDEYEIICRLLEINPYKYEFICIILEIEPYPYKNSNNINFGLWFVYQVDSDSDLLYSSSKIISYQKVLLKMIDLYTN